MTDRLTYALVGALVGVSLTYMYDKMTQKTMSKALERQFLSEDYKRDIAIPISASIEFDTSEEIAIQNEQLTRNTSFFGEDGVESTKSSFIIVVGTGGVGSHAATHLVRSGVGKLRIIDFDQVTLSSLNRHACAVRADVGTPKVEVLRTHFRTILPRTEIDARNTLFNAENAEILLSGNPDYVLDCIDNLETKIELLRYCHMKGIKVISSMGSACKSDPSRIQIADISETSEDKLAKAVRFSLRKFGITHGIPVVYSTERPSVTIVPLHPEVAKDPQQFSSLPNFRVRVLPVLGTIPAMFGCAMASFVLCALAKFPMEPLPVKCRKSVYQRAFSDLCTKEISIYKVLDQKIGHDNVGVLTDATEVGYILDALWCGRSCLSGSMDKLVLVRWDVRKPSRLDNLVPMTKQEAIVHDSLSPGSFETYYEPKFIAFVSAKLAKAGIDIFWE